MVIEPIDCALLNSACSQDLQNLNLHSQQPGQPTYSRPKCNTVVDVSDGFSDRFKQPSIPIPRDNKKRCRVCNVTVKGRRGLMLHLNGNPDCKRNVRVSGVCGCRNKGGCGCGGACAGSCGSKFLLVIRMVNVMVVVVVAI